MLRRGIQTAFMTKTLHPTFLQYRFGESLLMEKRQKQAKLAKKLKECLDPTYLQVNDTTMSGNSCGQMYKIIVESEKFVGKTRLQQHQMVSECIAEDMKKIHAVNIKTKIPQTQSQEQPEEKKDETEEQDNNQSSQNQKQK